MTEIKFCKLAGIWNLSEQIQKNAKPTTEAVRRKNWEQAIASARIEGFEPDAEYLANVEKNILGRINRRRIPREIHPPRKNGQQ